MHDVSRLRDEKVGQKANYAGHFDGFIEARSLEKIHKEMTGKGVQKARAMRDVHVVVRGSGRALSDLCVLPTTAQERDKKECTACEGRELL